MPTECIKVQDERTCCRFPVFLNVQPRKMGTRLGELSARWMDITVPLGLTRPGHGLEHAAMEERRAFELHRSL